MEKLAPVTAQGGRRPWRHEDIRAVRQTRAQNNVTTSVLAINVYFGF